tara:strand:+ start:1324 stop:1617 length:294 start_codon:yes stop_codon:yes gene_type:complete
LLPRIDSVSILEETSLLQLERFPIQPGAVSKSLEGKGIEFGQQVICEHRDEKEKVEFRIESYPSVPGRDVACAYEASKWTVVFTSPRRLEVSPDFYT